jgi:hypothetical protein
MGCRSPVIAGQKHLSKLTTVGMLFLERNVDFHQPVYAVYEYSKSNSVKHVSSALFHRKSGCSSHSQNTYIQSQSSDGCVNVLCMDQINSWFIQS